MSLPDVKSAVSGLELKGLVQSLARLGPVKLASLGAVALAALVGVFLIARAPEKPASLLYSGLDPAEAGRIVARLEELKVPLEARGDGTILVPADQVARLRMQLASEGLPRQSGAGYELLDQANPMQMTSFMQRVQRLRALEGELARTILALGSVKTARVHVVLPEREGFSREAPQPTASVTVTTQAGQRLSAAQAQAIRVLVAGAVPRLRQEDVSVVDPSGVVLAADGGTAAAGAGRIADLKAAQEAALRRSVLDLLEPIVGNGRVRAVASVELDAARSVAREEKYDPLGQVERSRQTQSESESNQDSRGQEPVSVGQNLPNQAVNQNAQRTTSSSQRNGETINYEISSRTEETVREPGAVRRLSVAVVVDGVPGPDGTVQDRSPEELQRLATLVRSAVGFDERRGDRVTVEQMRFRAEDAPGTLAAAAVPAGKSSWLWWALPLLALAGLGGAGLWRLRRQRQAAATLAAQAEDEALSPLEDAIASISPDIKVHMSSLSALQQLVDERPDEVLAVLRAWIEEGSPA